jgi:hypothetical protein
MNRFYSTLGIDQAIKEQEEDNIETNNKINYMKDWKEIFNDAYWNATEGRNDKRLNDISSLLSQQRKDILTELRLKLRNTYKAEDIADTAFLTESDLESVLNL